MIRQAVHRQLRKNHNNPHVHHSQKPFHLNYNESFNLLSASATEGEAKCFIEDSGECRNSCEGKGCKRECKCFKVLLKKFNHMFNLSFISKGQFQWSYSFPIFLFSLFRNNKTAKTRTFSVLRPYCDATHTPEIGEENMILGSLAVVVWENRICDQDIDHSYVFCLFFVGCHQFLICKLFSYFSTKPIIHCQSFLFIFSTKPMISYSFFFFFIFSS